MIFFKSNDKEKAKNDLEKAEERFEALRFKKAGNYYFSAGETYYEIRDFKSAENAFLNAAKSYIEEGDMYEEVLESLRKAINSSFGLEKYKYANEIIQKALGYINKLGSAKKKDNYYILFSALSYFCYFVEGVPENGLQLIKKIQRGIDQEFFKKNELIHLITNLTIALRDKKEIYLKRVKEDFNGLELNKVERGLIRKIVLLASIQACLTPKILFTQEEFTTNDLIDVNIELNINQIKDVIKSEFNSLKIENFHIIKSNVAHSDNLTIKKKPKFPQPLSLQNDLNINYVLKPHFLKDETLIGPVTIYGIINETYHFKIENKNQFELKLIPPPTHLDVSIETLKPPMIDTTFPLEIVIENNSESEARELEIKITLPDEINLMRGTLQKQIYSLRPNETIDWQISAKPNKAGDFEIKGDIKYKDPDQKILEEKESFAISIKL